MAVDGARLADARAKIGERVSPPFFGSWLLTVRPWTALDRPTRFQHGDATRPTSRKLRSRMRKFGVGRVIPQETVIAAITLRSDIGDFAASILEMVQLMLYALQPIPNLLHIDGIAV